MHDIQQDIAKQEDGKAPDFSTGLKQENGKVSEHASLQPQHIKTEDGLEGGKLADSEAEISSCDGSMKAEELQATEDGIAVCMEHGKDPSELLLLFCSSTTEPLLLSEMRSWCSAFV